MEKTAKKIIKKLRDAGYIAVYAGGYVRDKYMERPFKDIDISTSATPDIVMSMFKKTIVTEESLKHGAVKSVVDSKIFDVVTLREDGEYSDGRHADTVKFGCSLEEDAKRRDFTICAVFYDPIEEKYLDFVGGLKDIDNRILRFVGNPDKRIDEDKLRMLRLVRFARRFNFAVAYDSYQAVKKHSHLITTVSVERIRDELEKILIESYPVETMEMLKDLGLLKAILPEIDRLDTVEQGIKYHSEGNVWIHTNLVMRNVSSLVLRFAAMCHDVGKFETTEDKGEGKITAYGHEQVGAHITLEILKRFKCKNKFIGEVVSLVKDHMRPFQVKRMKKATLKRMFRHPLYGDLIALHRADLLGSGGVDTSTYDYACKRYGELSQEGFAPAPFVTGAVLIELGYTPSKLFKIILREVETKQLGGKLTSKEEAVEYVKTKWNIS